MTILMRMTILKRMTKTYVKEILFKPGANVLLLFMLYSKLYESD